MKNAKRKHEMTATEFMALPDEEKNRIFAELEAQTPEQRAAQSRPLNARERAMWKRMQADLRRGPGRPKLGEGAKKVSISVEPSLLDRLDAYAKQHGLKRSEAFARGAAVLVGDLRRSG